MKQILFLVIVIGLFSCSSEENKPYKPSIKEQLAEFEANVPAEKYYFQNGDKLTLEGKLDTLDVIMKIQKEDGRKLKGQLIHKSVGAIVPIEGWQDIDGMIQLYDIVMGSISGTWTGYISEDMFQGLWMTDTFCCNGYLLDFELIKSEDQILKYKKPISSITGFYEEEYSTKNLTEIEHNSIAIIINTDDTLPDLYKVACYNQIDDLEEITERTFEKLELIDNEMDFSYKNDTLEIECKLLFLNEKILLRTKRLTATAGSDFWSENKNTFTLLKTLDLETDFPRILGSRYIPW